MVGRMINVTPVIRSARCLAVPRITGMAPIRYRNKNSLGRYRILRSDQDNPVKPSGRRPGSKQHMSALRLTRTVIPGGWTIDP